VTIYKPDLKTLDPDQAPVAELSQHTGYVSGVQWLGDTQLVSSSGDNTCILWDLQTKKARTTFVGHDATATCVTVPDVKEQTVFVSGDKDGCCKVWDIRGDKAVQSYAKNHEAAVECVAPFGAGPSYFLSASADSSCRLFDIRKGQIAVYQNDRVR
jgi:WD40 repeat protein